MKPRGLSAPFLGVLLASSTASALPRVDNLTFVGVYETNDFVEFLDVWIGTKDIAYLTGVGGLRLLDISDPTDMTMLDRFQPTGHPWKRFYTASVDEQLDVVYCAAREDGLYTFSTFIPSDIQLMGLLELPGISIEGTAIHGDVLYGAGHEAGILIFSLNNPLNPFWLDGLTVTAGIEDARRMTVKDDYLLVADGTGGLKVLETADPLAPTVIRAVETSGPAQELALIGDLLVVAAGTAGMDIVDVSDPAKAEKMGNYTSEFSIFDLAGRGDLAYAASWSRVDIVDISEPSEPRHVGWEDTPGRAMSVGNLPESIPETDPGPARTLSSPRDPDPARIVYVADWFSFRAYEYGPPYDADIDVHPVLIETGSYSPGTVADTTYTVVNTGGAAVEVTDVIMHSGPDDFEMLSPASFTIPAGDSVDIHVRYTASDDTTVSARWDFLSNDPDEPSLAIYWDAGFGLTVGDPAPDFTLNGLDGFPFRLSDYKERIVLLAFFTSW